MREPMTVPPYKHFSTNWGQNGVKASFVELQNDAKS